MIFDLLNFWLIEINSYCNSWFRFLAQEPQVDLGAADFRFANDIVFALHLAASGWGVALARAPASDSICASLNLQPCLLELAIVSQQDYYLTYPGLSNLSPPAVQFRNWLLDEIAQQDYGV